MTNTPAGWYPQNDGRQRYWDGEKWTEHFADAAQQQQAAPAAVGAPAAPAAVGADARPWFKKKRFIIPGGLVAAFILIGALTSGGGDDTDLASTDTSSSVTSTTEAADATPSAAASAKAAPAATTKAPAPVDNTPKIGTKVRDGKFEFVVTGVKCGIDKVGGADFNTKAQGEFCRVSMTISNIGDEAQSMFADNQIAFDAKNRKFSADTEASIYDDKSEVLFEEINPGNTVEGRVYFDVPKDTTLVKIELHDSMFSGGVEVALKK